MPSYPCKAGTCGRYLPSPGYCDAHAEMGRKARRDAARDYNANRRDATRQAFYDSAAWQRCRRSKLERFPLCERCHAALASHVHHVTPISTPDGWRRRLSQAGLMGLCQPCHNVEHGKGSR